MADNKLCCCVVLRLESSGSTLVAKYDHAGQQGVSSVLYGGDKHFTDAVQEAVSRDIPGGLSGGFGGFKVVHTDVHQLIYGADSSGLCLAVVTGLRYPSRVAISMLEELYKEYSTQFGNNAKMAPANSLTKKSKTLLSGFCKKYENPSSVDKAQKVLGQVDQVKNQMGENIAGMLDNTQKAEDLAAKSNELNQQADAFKRISGDLKKKMKWKDCKMTIVLVTLVVGILLAILIPFILRARNNKSA